MMNHLSDKYKEKLVLRGDLYYADLSPVIGSEQGGLRPVLIVQNNTGNRHSPTVIVAAITSRTCLLYTSVGLRLNSHRLFHNNDLVILIQYIQPVSYTHLDVYKRQIQSSLTSPYGV